MVNILEPKNTVPPSGSALLALGFRPFFLFAALFAVVGMAQWALVYHGLIAFPAGDLTVFQWHAHEMILGFATAVIAGFLLTSVRNWTGQPTPVGKLLGLMVMFWLVARCAFAVGGQAILLGVLSNLAFLIGFLWSISSRIARVKQWRQGGIVLVIALLTLAEATVLVGLLERDQRLISTAIQGAFYLVVLLILVMGRRVVPFFVERGVGYPCSLKQSLVLDVVVIVGFAGFALTTLLLRQPLLSAGLAAIAGVAQGIRLWWWHTPGIWRRPLLWSLYLSLGWIELGLLLAALAPWLGLSSYLVTHAFTVGGVGFITLSMMSRVSLGHTGRDVHRPPPIVVLSLVVMGLAAFCRVIPPLLTSAHYGLWIGLSQGLWVLAFVLFLVNYLPILIAPRVDGRPG